MIIPQSGASISDLADKIEAGERIAILGGRGVGKTAVVEAVRAELDYRKEHREGATHSSEGPKWCKQCQNVLEFSRRLSKGLFGS